MAKQIVPGCPLCDKAIRVGLCNGLRVETVFRDVDDLDFKAHRESHRAVLEYGFDAGTVVFTIFGHIDIRDKAQCRGVFLELLQLVLRPRRSKRSNCVLNAQ